MEIIYVISGVCSLAMMIAFFYLCYNVYNMAARDRKRGRNISYDFKKHLFYGEIEKAREVYKELFWEAYLKMEREGTANQEKNYEALKKDFDKLEALNIAVPDKYIHFHKISVDTSA